MKRLQHRGGPEREGDLLTGMAAIVTGAARGIGLSVVDTFLAHGASVMAVDLDEAAIEAVVRDRVEVGPRLAGRSCDVTSVDDQEAVVSHTLAAFGRVDVLVNNAGITRDGYLTKMSVADFDAVLDVNLKGAWLGTRAVTPRFRAQRSGVIVNVSSLSGKVGNPGQTNYSAAKAGLIGLTKAAAKELGPFGVRVNAVQPGLVRTDMTLAMKPEIFAAKEAEVPMGRAGEPYEVAAAILFLSCPLASYVNGAGLEVAGGRGI
jgi:3-oxoacyl-[acyl-carrier protein] reductase